MLRESDEEASENDDSDGSNQLETIQEREEEEEEDPSDEDGKINQVGDIANDKTTVDFANYGDASFRGQTRSLWKASRMTEDQLQESNLKQNFDDMEEHPKTSDDEISSENHDDYDDDGLSELLHVFNSIDDNEQSTAMDDVLGPYAKDLCSQVHKPDPDENEDGNDCEHKHNLNDPTTMSQLSPAAKSAFTKMTIKVQNDPEKVAILDSECPNWKENLRYALRQSPSEVEVALANVREKQRRIAKAMEMLKKQSAVLEVFDMALNDSLDRFDKHEVSNLKQDDFMSQL